MGGGAPKAEKQQQQQSWSNLNALFGTANETAKSFGGAAKTDMDKVKQYFSTLLGGDRTATMKAIAPAANAARAQGDTAKSERARTGTSRTGGDAAETSQIDDKVRAQIDNLIGAVAPAAAQSLLGIGETELSAMLNSLGLATSATGTAGAQISQDINSRRQASAQMWGSLLGGIADIATAPLGGTLLGKI